MTLEQERRALEEEYRQLERERQELAKRIEIEDRRLEQQQKLFEMKFRILEEELVKLANEKEQLEKQKAFYRSVCDFEAEQSRRIEPSRSFGDVFFCGVGSKQSLKKRYKDLIKIYHPDNMDGDDYTIQEINREYDQLSKVFS